MHLTAKLEPPREEAGDVLALARDFLRQTRTKTAESARMSRGRTARRVAGARRRARERGYEEGLLAGRTTLGAALESLAEVSGKVAGAARESLIEVALQIVEEVIADETRRGSPHMGARIDKALARVGSGRPIALLGNPGDEASIRRWAGATGIAVESSSRIPPGEVRILMNAGEIELSLVHHLRSIEGAVRAAWRASCRNVRPEDTFETSSVRAMRDRSSDAMSAPLERGHDLQRLENGQEPLLDPVSGRD